MNQPTRACPAIPRSVARRSDQHLAALSPPHKTTPQNHNSTKPPHKTTPQNRCAISRGPRIAARFRGDPGSPRDFAGTPDRRAISRGPRIAARLSRGSRPSSAVAPPQLSSSALPAAARPPLATSRDRWTRPHGLAPRVSRPRALATVGLCPIPQKWGEPR
jgi:hypothetical protein